MNNPRRQFMCAAVCAAALPALGRSAWTQSYPSRPVRIVVPQAAGGGTDIRARLIGQWLSERLGQPFIVENRPGAGGTIGTEVAVKAPPDGHTLLLIGTSSAINATLYQNLSFNLLRDISPVASVSRNTLVLVVHPSVPARSVPELIAYTKAHPGKLNIASAGNGTNAHLTGELFKMMTSTNLVHVPYRGGAPATTDLIAGQVQVSFDDITASIEHIRAGKLRALAVTTTTRSEALPEVPVISEFVPGFEASGWSGIGSPRNTSAEIIDRLNREITAALADPKIKARFAELGSSVLPGSPSEFGKLIADEIDKWGKVIRAANVKVQ